MERFRLESQLIGIGRLEKKKPVEGSTFYGADGRGLEIVGNVAHVFREKDHKVLERIPLTDLPVGWQREVELTPFLMQYVMLGTQVAYIIREE